MPCGDTPPRRVPDGNVSGMRASDRRDARRGWSSRRVVGTIGVVTGRGTARGDSGAGLHRHGGVSGQGRGRAGGCSLIRLGNQVQGPAQQAGLVPASRRDGPVPVGRVPRRRQTRRTLRGRAAPPRGRAQPEAPVAAILGRSDAMTAIRGGAAACPGVATGCTGACGAADLRTVSASASAKTGRACSRVRR